MKRRMPNRSVMGSGVYWESMSTWERGLLEWALGIGKGNYEMTARILGITKGHVYNRCRTLEIDVTQFVPKKDPPVLTKVEKVTVATATEPEPEDDEVDPGEDDLDEDEVEDDTDEDVADDEAADEVADEDADTDAAAEETADEDEFCPTCDAKLVTNDELTKWLECTPCHQKRVTKRVSEKTIVAKKENGA